MTSSMISPRQRDCIGRRVREILARSPLPEDLPHAEDVFERVSKARPGDLALAIAALGHDVERALPHKTCRRDYADYDAFKRAHAERSAQVLAAILRDCGVADEDFIRNVTELVRLHETGGTPEADVLNAADAYSFFEVNLPSYFERNTREECRRRILWGLKRLSPAQRARLTRLRYPSEELNRLLRDCLRVGLGHGRVESSQAEDRFISVRRSGGPSPP